MIDLRGECIDGPAKGKWLASIAEHVIVPVVSPGGYAEYMYHWVEGAGGGGVWSGEFDPNEAECQP